MDLFLLQSLPLVASRLRFSFHQDNFETSPSVSNISEGCIVQQLSHRCIVSFPFFCWLQSNPLLLSCLLFIQSQEARQDICQDDLFFSSVFISLNEDRITSTAMCPPFYSTVSFTRLYPTGNTSCSLCACVIGFRSVFFRLRFFE